MRGLWAIACKEFLHIKRDPTIIFFALIIPSIQLAILGYALDFDIRHISTAVVDYDISRESRDFVAKLVKTQYVRVTSYQASKNEALEQIRRGQARIAIIIPPDFGTRPQAAIYLDGSDAQTISRAAAAFKPPGQIQTGQPNIHTTILYNPGGETSLFMIPGLVGIIIQMVTIVLTALSLVKEREQGTLEQLMVSPVGRTGLMIGKMLPYAIMSMLEMGLVLFVARLLFNITIAGSLWQLVFMTIPFVLATLSLGLLISALATNQGQALQMVVIVMIPSILLSGFVFPLDNLPLPLRIISVFVPATHYMEILRGTIIRGIGLHELWHQTTILWTMAIVLVAAAASKFRKSSI